MKKIFSIITFILLMFVINTTFEASYALDTPEIDIKQELKNEIPDDVINHQSDDELEKPIFEEEAQKPAPNKAANMITSVVIKGICLILLLILCAICLLFVVMANKQRQNDIRRKKMSANTNVINAVDNFARHRIKR